MSFLDLHHRFHGNDNFQFLVSICISHAEITFVAPAVPEKLQNDYWFEWNTMVGLYKYN